MIDCATLDTEGDSRHATHAHVWCCHVSVHVSTSVEWLARDNKPHRGEGAVPSALHKPTCSNKQHLVDVTRACRRKPEELHGPQHRRNDEAAKRVELEAEVEWVPRGRERHVPWHGLILVVCKVMCLQELKANLEHEE